MGITLEIIEGGAPHITCGSGLARDEAGTFNVDVD
jgi:hypothetical protein